MRPQTTLRSSSDWIAGVHLDQHGDARIRFHPANADEGIRFIRADLPGRPEVVCAPQHLRSMPRWTALEHEGVEVHHTEHVLAALYLAGVDNVRVELECSRVPMTAGCGVGVFYRALEQTGLIHLDAPKKVLRLRKPFFYLDAERTTGTIALEPQLRDGRYVLGLPSDRLSVSYVFHWPHVKDLPLGVAEFEACEGPPPPDLLNARSYLVENELQNVKLGPVQFEVMRLYPGCPAALAQEAARHKIVDFLGDIMILGRPVLGRFVAFRAGHRIHHEVVRQWALGDYLELVEA